MEIEFNPNQAAVTRANWPVKGTPAPPATNQEPAPQGTAELQRKLYDLSLVRPEKMEAARQVLMDVKYPPEELLNGIAHLLAIKLTP